MADFVLTLGIILCVLLGVGFGISLEKRRVDDLQREKCLFEYDGYSLTEMDRSCIKYFMED